MGRRAWHFRQVLISTLEPTEGQMQATTVGTLTNDHNGTIFVAVELNQKTWRVTLHSPDRDRVSRHKLDGGDHAGLLELIEKVRVARGELLRGAGYDGFWPHRLLGCRDCEFRVRPSEHCSGAAIAADQDGSDRRRASAADVDGLLAWRATGGPDRAGAECGAGRRPPFQPRTRSAGQGTDRPYQPGQGFAAAGGHGGRLPASRQLAGRPSSAIGKGSLCHRIFWPK